jgi:transcriptional regulator with XRE-family HTH domain
MARSALFPALLRHWRSRRGLSQLDLALAADVSARHISFLETGRARPSREMILQLAASLSVPLREQNALLRAAGFPDEYPEPNPNDVGKPIRDAIARMLAQHEPYPMLVLDRRYDVVQLNGGATRLFTSLVRDPSRVPAKLNAMHALFDTHLLRSAVLDWERIAHGMVARLHRETLARPEDAELAGLLRSLFEYPDVPESWRQADFAAPNDAALTLRLKHGDQELAFLATLTMFSAPQNVTLEELRIESYFPLDDATARACADALARR